MIVTTLAKSGLVSACLAHGKADETEIRRRSLFGLVASDSMERVSRLVIESREGRDDQDRRALYEAVRDRANPMEYLHLSPSQDAGLWVADAIAWCFGRGGLWVERVGPMVTAVVDVGDAKTRETRLLTVRRGAGPTSCN